MPSELPVTERFKTHRPGPRPDANGKENSARVDESDAPCTARRKPSSISRANISYPPDGLLARVAARHDSCGSTRAGDPDAGDNLPLSGSTLVVPCLSRGAKRAASQNLVARQQLSDTGLS